MRREEASESRRDPVAAGLREWDPARREDGPSEAERLWFRQRLLAEAREASAAGVASLRPRRFAAAAGAALLVVLAIALWRSPERASAPVSGPAERAALEPVVEPVGEPGAVAEVLPGEALEVASAPEPALEVASAPEPALEVASAPEPALEVAGPDAEDPVPVESTAEGRFPAAGPSAPPDPVALAAVDSPPSAPPRVTRTRQLQLRGRSGTRLLWTFDPDFDAEIRPGAAGD